MWSKRFIPVIKCSQVLIHPLGIMWLNSWAAKTVSSIKTFLYCLNSTFINFFHLLWLDSILVELFHKGFQLFISIVPLLFLHSTLRLVVRLVDNRQFGCIAFFHHKAPFVGLFLVKNWSWCSGTVTVCDFGNRSIPNSSGFHSSCTGEEPICNSFSDVICISFSASILTCSAICSQWIVPHSFLFAFSLRSSVSTLLAFNAHFMERDQVILPHKTHIFVLF